MHYDLYFRTDIRSPKNASHPQSTLTAQAIADLVLPKLATWDDAKVKTSLEQEWHWEPGVPSTYTPGTVGYGCHLLTVKGVVADLDQLKAIVDDLTTQTVEALIVEVERVVDETGDYEEFAHPFGYALPEISRPVYDNKAVLHPPEPPVVVPPKTVEERRIEECERLEWLLTSVERDLNALNDPDFGTRKKSVVEQLRARAAKQKAEAAAEAAKE